MTSDEILSFRLRRETMSAARSSSEAVSSQMGHADCGAEEHHLGAGSDVPPSTQSAGDEPTSVMAPLAAEKASACSGSEAEQSAVVTRAPTDEVDATRHVAGVCCDLIDDALITQSSFCFEPRPHGKV